MAFGTPFDTPTPIERRMPSDVGMIDLASRVIGAMQ